MLKDYSQEVLEVLQKIENIDGDSTVKDLEDAYRYNRYLLSYFYGAQVEIVQLLRAQGRITKLDEKK